jgi:hypothetical protein
MAIATQFSTSNETLTLGEANRHRHHSPLRHTLPRHPHEVNKLESHSIRTDITKPCQTSLVPTTPPALLQTPSPVTSTTSLSSARREPSTCPTLSQQFQTVSNCTKVEVEEGKGKDAVNSDMKTFELVAHCCDPQGKTQESRILLCPFIWNDSGTMKWLTV